jgi:hypothetical protein
MVFDNIRKTYDLFSTEELLSKISVSYFTEGPFQKIATHQAKIRILIRISDQNSNLIDVINKAKWPAVDLTIKTTDKTAPLYYAIIDGKEAWIPLESLPNSTVLVTDSKAVVRIAQESFEKIWDDNKTRTIFQQERNKILQKRKQTSTSVSHP